MKLSSSRAGLTSTRTVEPVDHRSSVGGGIVNFDEVVREGFLVVPTVPFSEDAHESLGNLRTQRHWSTG